MRLAVVMALLAAAAAVLSAQPGTRDAIRLDVIVDGLNPREPLRAADFGVTEGGQPLVVDSVRLVTAPPPSSPLPATITDDNEETAAADAARLVAIYVDEYHLSDDAAFTAARAALARFVREVLGPRDLVVVLKPLDSLVSIRLTADREAAARVIESAVPRLGDYTARSAFEQDFIAAAPARVDAARSQIALSSISALATHLGRFDAGRKTLIVMSNGLGSTSPSRRDQFLPGLDSIGRVANRGRVAVYVVQPAAAPGTSRAVADRERDAHDPLEALARQTTGLVIGGDRVAAGLDRLAAEASRYYLLTLAPPGAAPDGRFRSVDVSVRRPGAIVRARAGYAVRIAEPALTRRPTIPEGLKVPRHTSTLIRTWFGQSGGGDGATRVDFVWEPAPAVPGTRRAAVPSRVAMSVTTLDGTPVFAGTAAASGRDGLVAAGQRPQLVFDAAPGPLLVQMQILDAGGRVLDRDVRDLMVGGFDDPLAFGTAAVFRARTMPALRAIAEGTRDATPVAARDFSRAEQLLVRVPLSGRAGDEAAVHAQLESRFGSTLRDIPITLATPSLVEVQLPLAGLASGGYALVFEARAGTANARTRVEFTVTP